MDQTACCYNVHDDIRNRSIEGWGCSDKVLTCFLSYKLSYFGYVPDHVGTLAQVGNSPSLGWPNKELRGSQPI